jgi:ribonuclease P protein component
MPICAGSNTALFWNRLGHEANLPAFEDAARAASRLSGAHALSFRTRGHPRPARSCASPASGVGSPQGVLGDAAHESRRAQRRRFGLGADRRLARRRDFEQLLRDGVRRSLSGYTFYVAQRPEGPPRLGILVSRKHSREATVRNRIKRCIREAFRQEQEALGALDVLVRPPYAVRPGPAMMLRLRQLLAKLGP